MLFRSLALDGWVGHGGDGSLLYVPYYFGWIASYSPTGELRYMVETIDRIPDPSIRRSGNGMLWIDPDTRVSAKSAWISGGNLYLLSGNAAGSRFSRMVDVYDTVNGTYRYSFEAPEAGASILVQRDSLYVVQDTGLCKWTLGPSAALQVANNE